MGVLFHPPEEGLEVEGGKGGGGTMEYSVSVCNVNHRIMTEN